MKERKKILTMLVENNYGVTSRVSGMFSRRGFNLDSFTGCDTLDPRFSRITVVVHGDEQVLEQIYTSMKLGARACHKLLKVARTIADLAGSEIVRKEDLLEAACYCQGQE